MSDRRFPAIAFTCVFPCLLLTQSLRADDFLGAAQLMEKLNGASKPAPSTASGNDAASLLKDVDLFSKTQDGLAPDTAARQWLALCQRVIKLRNDPAQGLMSGNLMPSVFQVLPSPPSWPGMLQQFAAQPAPGTADAWSQGLLRLTLDTLNNDETHQWSDLTALESSGAGTDTTPSILTLGSKLSIVAEQPDSTEKFWDHILGELEKNPSSPGGEDGDNAAEFPDLVTFLGPDRAKPLIQRALFLPHANFAFAGKGTADLARKIAIANLDKLQQAPWGLTESLDGSDLFEALVKKFGAAPPNESGAIYHMLALAIHGKSADAVKAAATISGNNIEEAVTKAAEAGYGDQVYDFLHELLQEHPEDDDWRIYVQLAAQTGNAPAALQFVQASQARQDLSDVARVNIEQVLYRALLAVDKVDEGIGQLRALIAKTKASPASIAITGTSYRMPNGHVYFSQGNTDTAEKIGGWDIQLARLGHLLKRSDLEQEGLADARLQPDKEDLVRYLMETGRNSEAENILIDTIVAESAKEQGGRQGYGYMDGMYSPNQRNLISLAQVYYNAGRWTDILTLLDQAPGWGAADLLSIAKEKAYSERYTPASLGLMAARALSETGRLDEARRVLDYVLQVDGGDDAAYELLLKIGQGDLVEKLDALYHEDQFQNRPLIWKATLLLQQGKVDEAEQACKTAIAVDPSDGETGKGNRMRVYSVMADVCTAKKDPKQAVFFQNVVKAIRLSENADDFYDAGLLTRAVSMYAQALDLFSDAYCIQSRIARQLAELGRLDEAAVHYRKAFELMPVSFGRMESHCFGCERAFEGKTAVSIAEQTFTDMLAKDPKKPQLYYLLGYLYMEQQEYPKALLNFQKAAGLDPDYINAWKQIYEIGTNYRLAPTVRDEAVFNLLRLDPAGRHVNPDTDNVRQLDKLWTAETASVRALPPAPVSLYPLKATAADQALRRAQMEKMVPSGYNAAMIKMLENQYARFSGAPKDASAPRTAVLGNGIIASVLEFFR